MEEVPPRPVSNVGEVSRWRDLVRPRQRYLYRRASLEAITQGTSGDNILYTANRNIAPPFSMAGGTTWCCDSLEFSAGMLPTGEYARSLGHWNLPDETEIFYVDAGMAIMLYGWNGSPVFQARMVQGNILVLPPAAWHITYCITQEATRITNIYSREYSSPGQHETTHKRAKRATGLPRVTLVSVAGEAVLTGPDRAMSLTTGEDPATCLAVSPVGALGTAFARAGEASELRAWLLRAGLPAAPYLT